MTAAAAPRADGARAGEALSYHEATKHSWASVRSDPHGLDWANRPHPFKLYPEAPVVPLPLDPPAPARPVLEALARVTVREGRAGLDLGVLAALLFFSAGVTRRKVYPGGEAVHFRAAASTGALYQTEAYVVAGPVEGLEAGVYHFAPGDFVLRRLRAGDHRARLAAAAGRADLVADAPATLVLSAIHWRNTWKYRARAFRHFFWDAGTVLANLLATAVALEVPARVLAGFADGAVNALLGLDDAREGSLVLVPLGRGAGAPPASPAAPPLALPVLPLSAREVDYPLVRAAYQASALPDGDAARAWIAAPAADGRRASEPAGAAAGAAAPERPSPSVADTIRRRGSTRAFGPAAIDGAAFAAILDAALRPLPLDVEDAAPPLVDTYWLLHAVTGRAPGAYAWDPASRELRLLRAGARREESGHLCLGQRLGADAGAVVFFLADLGRLVARWGSRGYRVANLAAGLLGGRLYLGAYGLGLGATGLTFYDDDVPPAFGPAAAGRDALFVTALGHALRRDPAGGLAPAPAVIESLGPGDA